MALGGYIVGRSLRHLNSRESPSPHRATFVSPASVPTASAVNRGSEKALVWSDERLRQWLENARKKSISLSDSIWNESPAVQRILRKKIWRLLRSEGDWKAALSVIYEAFDSSDTQAWLEFWGELKKENPAELSDFLASELTAGRLKYSLMWEFFNGWIEHDAKSAASFLRELKGTESWKASFRSEAIGMLLARSPSDVSEADLATAFDSIPDPIELIASLGNAFGISQPERAYAWADSLPNPAQKRLALQSVMTSASASNDVFWSLFHKIDDRSIQKSAVESWGTNRAIRAKEDGLTSVLEIDDSQFRESALQGYFRNMMGHDPATTTQTALSLYHSRKIELSTLELVFQSSKDQALAVANSKNHPAEVAALAQKVLKK
jgi:hypothetical protein